MLIYIHLMQCSYSEGNTLMYFMLFVLWAKIMSNHVKMLIYIHLLQCCNCEDNTLMYFMLFVPGQIILIHKYHHAHTSISSNVAHFAGISTQMDMWFGCYVLSVRAECITILETGTKTSKTTDDVSMITIFIMQCIPTSSVLWFSFPRLGIGDWRNVIYDGSLFKQCVIKIILSLYNVTN
jgi:hypothetical protein